MKPIEELAKEWKRANAKKRARIDLDFDGNGRPLASINNFLQVLENDPKFDGIRFNLLTYSPEQMRNGKMERWLDSDDAETRRYIEKEYGFHSAQKCDDAFWWTALNGTGRSAYRTSYTPGQSARTRHTHGRSADLSSPAVFIGYFRRGVSSMICPF